MTTAVTVRLLINRIFTCKHIVVIIEILVILFDVTKIFMHIEAVICCFDYTTGYI